MKKVFLIAILSIFAIVSKAQGNLQFNQVLTYGGFVGGQIVPNGSFSINSTDIWEVPMGKVWKLENWTSTDNIQLLINDILFISKYDRVLWLKPGDRVRFNYFGGCSGGPGGCFIVSASYFISILEFNVVP
jgi:hypothetical protein